MESRHTKRKVLPGGGKELAVSDFKAANWLRAKTEEEAEREESDQKAGERILSQFYEHVLLLLYRSF